MSFGVALPLLIMKFACFSLIVAPPTVLPFKLDSSINLPAMFPSGFLNTLPHEGYSSG